MRKMTAYLLTIIAIVLVMNAVCLAQPQTLLTRHVRDIVSNGQAKLTGHMPSNQTLHIDIVLPVPHRIELQNFLQELQDPASVNYHKFLTPPEFTARFGPPQEEYDAVVQFVKANGFEFLKGSLDSRDIQLLGTVATIEKAFHVNINLYQDPVDGRSFHAPDREPMVDLPFQLWHITGMDNGGRPRPAFVKKPAGGVHSLATTGSCPSASFCGSDMRAAYYGSGSLTGAGQNMALFELAGTDLADLTTYYKNAGQTEPFTPTLISTGGYSTSCLDSAGCDDTEQTLDMTQEMGMAPGAAALYMYVCGDAYGTGDFSATDCLSAMVTTTDAPLSKQISASWNWSPDDPSSLDPYFEQMASQGQNYFNASGDSGNWATATYVWPEEDPNVVAVGGTSLTTTKAGGAWSAETYWYYNGTAYGGGGISRDDLPIPSYQQLSGVITSANEGSTSYRNGPDVSANAQFSFYVCADQTTCTANSYGGTSFAAPMWAGFLALANQQAASNGDTIGFINPIIYPAALTSSYSTYFHAPSTTCDPDDGYPCVAGYNLDTGWGSPNGAGLINLLAPTSSSGFSLSASPSTISIADGGTGSVTITSSITGGFDGTITLSASGEPSGVTVAFSPTSITGAGSSTMTFTVGSSVTAGTYTITVTGTSGSTTETTTVSLTITSTSSGFSISASPTSISIDRGKSGTVTITSTVTGGFDGTITLSASGEGGKQTVSFSPTSITGAGTSTMTIKVGSSAALGDHTITVKGTSGSTSHTTKVTLDVLK